ncbi:MAG: FtsW/RodA/SpoVE family cell cycle protein, partial [Phycisphaeraceae bacterium]|nr:FtsW/RodA/SpoVE family cell cycle protein [Phycisphaeraceae bacterium]
LSLYGAVWGGVFLGFWGLWGWGGGGITGNPPSHARNLLHYNHLPERHNDMIFAVIVNRWGVIGGLVVLTLYVMLLGTMLTVAARSKDPFAQLSCVGFAALIFTQVVVNIGMTLGLLPIIGITLPFLSYGGSSLLASFAMIGLTMNFASRPTAPLVRPSFEFDTTTEQLEPAA